MQSFAWRFAGVLFVVHAALVVDTLRQPVSPTFVLTPLVDVVPGTLDAASGQALQAARLDVRSVTGAVSRYGSTFSVDDLARAILTLDDLSAAQKARLAAIVDANKASHDEAVRLQSDITTAEATLLRAAAPLQALLPAAPGAPGAPNPPNPGAPNPPTPGAPR